MNLHLYWPLEKQQFLAWLYICIILHNMLAKLGDKWLDLPDEEGNSISSLFNLTNSNPRVCTSKNSELFQEKLTNEWADSSYINPP
ncbi:hypothetical protein VP01_1379g4 [Puccinia sorghi]|uniref:DDE Tnp4 domain-containing protein n=1 Tax=Puccinia sorghi TaxID=27349 RepID=A0A0L6VLG4_9BASI|nr:hypothetical protein VP01_1379g4 [Puccinia sorghi]